MAERESEARRAREPARTTIVGGQPPGNARPLGEVPVGLEQLLGMAAVDEAFRAALLADPRGTAETVGVELVEAEGRILDAITAERLDAMIVQVGARLPAADRRTFIASATVAVLALAGGAGLAASACRSAPRKRDPVPAGIRPRPAPGPIPAGIRPEPAPLEPKSPGPDAGPSVADAQVKPKPPRPKPSIQRGIRPDRPRLLPNAGMRAQRGIQPDRPAKKVAPKEKGD